ncbi:Kinesin-like protein KIN-14S [Vitis vinifera]|uniref:Kinesin-like protein KIN-14S n=1 Tax=Vitis vinifera TaxID=29760 RepID=A0A438HGN2_VITVI|nr:Kinesin-like protein KIN-14S [Vitis vinifera]
MKTFQEVFGFHILESITTGHARKLLPVMFLNRHAFVGVPKISHADKREFITNRGLFLAFSEEQSSPQVERGGRPFWRWGTFIFRGNLSAGRERNRERLPVYEKIDELSTDTRVRFEETLGRELASEEVLEEGLEQKRLYNEVIQLRGNNRVFYRCRPLNQAEMANGSTSIVDFEPSRKMGFKSFALILQRSNFKFDHVFRPGSDQEAVFGQTSPNCDFHAGWV